jgi:hypothetical protein
VVLNRPYDLLVKQGVLTHPIGDYAVRPRDATFAAHGVTMAHYINGGAYTVGGKLICLLMYLLHVAAIIIDI